MERVISKELLKLILGAALRQAWLQISSMVMVYEHEHTPITVDRSPGEPLQASKQSSSSTQTPSGALAPVLPSNSQLLKTSGKQSVMSLTLPSDYSS